MIKKVIILLIFLFSFGALWSASVTLKWDSYVDQANITGFTLERSQDTTTWTVVASAIAPDAVTFTDDVAPGYRYYWRLKAVGSGGESEESNWTSKFVPYESPQGLGVE